MSKEQISKFEFLTISVLYILANDIIRLIYYEIHGNNTWILVLFGIIGSILIVYVYLFIYKNFDYMSFNEIIEKIIGKFLSKIIFFVYGIYFVGLSALNLRDMIQLVKIYLIDLAPMFMIGLILLLVVYYALTKSIEVIVRSSTLLYFLVEIIYLIFTTLAIIFNKVELANLYPILDKGIKPILIDSLKYAYSVPLGELFVLLIIFQYINKKNKATKIFYLSILQAGIMLLLLTFLNIILVAPEDVTVDYSAALRVARVIDIELFIQRVDLLVICLFAVHIYSKIAILLFSSKLLLKSVMKFNKENLIYFILCGLTLYLSLYEKSYDKIILFRKSNVHQLIKLVFEIIIPFSLVFLSFLRKPKKNKNQNDNQNIKNMDKNNTTNNDHQQDSILSKIKNTFNKKVLRKKA